MAKSSKPGNQPRRNGEKDKAAKDPELVAFGLRLCRLREAAGLTQESLAQAAGLHWTYVGQVERGERNLTYKNVLKLARGLGREPAELLPQQK
jgi:transcriptional regulator with XRE-family HTH domain